MNLARTTFAALVLVLSLVAGCGGSGAALQIQQYPGDRDASPRRLESLAREFENTFGCTEADTIQITGMAPGVYNVQGCNAMRDYMLGCRAGGYAGQICSWQAIPDLAQQASIDMNCGPQYLDIQPAGPNQRSVDGCGFHAVYALQCGGGGCGWALAGRIEQTGPATQGGGSYTY